MLQHLSAMARSQHFVGKFAAATILMTSLCASGCQDGPLYALKKANPYFTMMEWKEDTDFGVTDYQRHSELQKLAAEIGSMPMKQQNYWFKHLGRIMNNDPSPEMRRLAIQAAASLRQSGSLELIEKGLDDESLKVQMAACTALGRRGEPEAAQLLASVVGTTPELDVKNSAIAALGRHKNQMAIDSLRVVLEDLDPATTQLAISSLRGVTGKNLGNDPKRWIAAIDQTNQNKALPGAAPAGGDSNEIRYAQGEGVTIQR